MITCDECKSVFENNYVFMRHCKVTHSAMKVFKCNELYCQKSFSILNSFIRHRRDKHRDNKESSKSVSSKSLVSSTNNSHTSEINELSAQCSPDELTCSDEDLFVLFFRIAIYI